MKTKITLALVVILVALAGVTAARDASGVADVKPCHKLSWSPEIFTFYGDVDTVIGKLSNANGNLTTRRVFAFVVESRDGNSHLGLFERTEDGGMTLGKVSKTSFGALVHDLSSDLLANNGVQCAGELTRERMSDYDLLDGVEYTNLAQAPTNLTEAFKTLGLSGKDYVRVTIALLC